MDQHKHYAKFDCLDSSCIAMKRSFPRPKLDFNYIPYRPKDPGFRFSLENMDPS